MNRSGAARTRSRLILIICTAGGVVLSALAGCTTGVPAGGQSDSASSQAANLSSAAPSSTSAQDGAALAVITTTPNSGSVVNPIAPVGVSVADGTLSSVTLVNPQGTHVTGMLSTDGTSWRTTEVLGYGKTYRLTAKAVNASGLRTMKESTFTTLTPSNQTMPYIDDLYGASIRNHGTYGIAMVVNVVFDEPIAAKAAAEKALHVTTSPHTTGSWYWVDDTHVHWRPEQYFEPGTKVAVAADVYGVEVGPGLYGQSDVKASFTIGRRQVTVANDRISGPHKRVKVYRGGHLVRSMYTAMGQHGGVTIAGNYINFYTLDGTYTVLGFENPAHMCSASYGLPADSSDGYPCEDVPWSTKISTDGIYLHQLDTIWDQEHGVDVSHGCLNLDYADAHWFFTHSLIGDPVKVLGAKGAPTLQLWQGGDWTLPWSQWLRGSALD